MKSPARFAFVTADRGPRGDGDVWSFAIDGDSAIVEIHAGPGKGRSPRGYQIDAVGHGTVRLDAKPVAPTPEVVCGTDGREDVACHLRERGFKEVQGPVARLLFASGGFFYLCTGWLADGPNDSTLVTNNHCISRQREVDSLQVTFNFQATRCGGPTIAPVSDYAGGLLLKTNDIQAHGRREGLDYTLLTLQGNPEATWGDLVPSNRSLAVGDLVWFIQHPGGRRKAVGYWEDAEQTVRCKLDAVDQSLRGVAAGSQTYYGCDSEGGSSGSPIVDPATGPTPDRS